MTALDPAVSPIQDVSAVRGRLRLALRWGRFTLKSLLSGDWKLAAQGVAAELRLAAQSFADLVPADPRARCNICGWRGRRFYPNSGPGYHELNTLCPSCQGLARHRSLVEILRRETSFFSSGSRVLEVAPMRGFQRLCLATAGIEYCSFDQGRFAMERGDLTAMRYDDASCDFFVCLHVLEHILDEKTALQEIYRVLAPGGIAVLQVPLDETLTATVEYGSPRPRETFHVRRYGRDFSKRIENHGFTVSSVRASSCVPIAEAAHLDLSDDPIYLAEKPR